MSSSNNNCDEKTSKNQIEYELTKSKEELFIKNSIANVFLTKDEFDLFNEVLRIVLDLLNSKYGFFGYINIDGNLVSPSLTRDIWNKIGRASCRERV